MAESKFQQPTDQQLEDFIKGDPLVIDEVIHILLPQLHRWAIQKYPTLARDEVQSVVNQVLAEACRNHTRYDPQKAHITTYLIGLISLRLKTLYRDAQKVVKFEEAIPEQQENLLPLVYNLSNVTRPENQFERRRFFEKVRERLDEVEGEILSLMIKGEKSQDEFLAILSRYQCITDLESDVKNLKERLKRKVKAIAEEMGYSKHDLLDE